jgi:hypothetical protein
MVTLLESILIGGAIVIALAAIALIGPTAAAIALVIGAILAGVALAAIVVDLIQIASGGYAPEEIEEMMSRDIFGTAGGTLGGGVGRAPFKAPTVDPFLTPRREPTTGKDLKPGLNESPESAPPTSSKSAEVERIAGSDIRHVNGAIA